jgi:hypothetical protein
VVVTETAAAAALCAETVEDAKTADADWLGPVSDGPLPPTNGKTTASTTANTVARKTERFNSCTPIQLGTNPK